MSKNPKKNKKNYCNKKSEYSKNIFCLPEKNAIILVLPIEEISLRPELSSPPCLRIQGG